MTSPWPNPPQIPPGGPTAWPATSTAEPITVPDLPCGHLPGDVHDDQCAFWWGVAGGEYADPVITLPPHAPGLTPLTDPALREVA
ncbi:hypothetical protein [Micromonospora sp. DT229]|uniref:hypothetical protein n=1 Tax=Micromonospora sp. DT229 TaxID=3393430 RepID=UPI003CF5F04E